MKQLNEGVNKSTKRKHFWDQISFVIMSVYTLGVILVISCFSKLFICPYLAVSHFGRPPVFRKQFVLDTALGTCPRYVCHKVKKN